MWWKAFQVWHCWRNSVHLFLLKRLPSGRSESTVCLVCIFLLFLILFCSHASIIVLLSWCAFQPLSFCFLTSFVWFLVGFLIFSASLNWWYSFSLLDNGLGGHFVALIFIRVLFLMSGGWCVFLLSLCLYPAFPPPDMLVAFLGFLECACLGLLL